LINAQTDSHLWAESYDRKLTDIFGVETEIAKRIAESLQGKLSGREEQALAAKPTNNPEAYDAYLRGLTFYARVSSFAEVAALMPKAIDSFKRAVQLRNRLGAAFSDGGESLLYRPQRCYSRSPRRGETCFGECAETEAQLT
jgi:hypothetical protein